MTSTDLRRVVLPDGTPVPALGLGTWHMAERPARRSQEVAALRLGVDLGLTLIDTAEMYADGGSEELVAEAIQGRRDEVFLVSKVMPHHASRRGTVAACEQSLRRLGTDHLDLYLLHWPGSVPFERTLEAFHSLQERGLIRRWGVSNFSIRDMQELPSAPFEPEKSGRHSTSLDPPIDARAVTTNQVLYNLVRRGIEYDLLPWCRDRGIPIMAYSPLEQGDLSRHPVLEAVARAHAATPAQIALAWVLRQPDVIAIPKASDADHVRQNRAALDLTLSDDDLAQLDQAFPAPRKPRPLEML